MAVQLPTFTLDLTGDMSLNWDYFQDTFASYATLMGYRKNGATANDKARELAALVYSLPIDTRIVLKNTISWGADEDKDDPLQNLAKLKQYYAGTKNVIHERVEFNEMRRMDSEQINSWQTRCRQQGVKCEYCDNCTPELIRDRFIIGINDKTLRTTLVNRAVKEPRISLEKTVLHAHAYEATLVSTGTEEKPDHVQEQVNYTASSRQTQEETSPE